MDVAITSPRWDSYSFARFTVDHIATDPNTGAAYVLAVGDKVSFRLYVEPGTFDREALNVQPA
jgi:hypothetical protein